MVQPSAPIVFADAVSKVGDKIENLFASAWGNFKLISKLMGVEDVFVPAGDFADCLKFKVTLYDIMGGLRISTSRRPGGWRKTWVW